MKNRPYVIYIHYNKQKSAYGFPWTVRTSKACIPASRVVINTPLEAIYKPEKKNNPRAFLRTIGFIKLSNDGVVTING